MPVIVYGIRNCDTVKRARRELDAAGIDYRFHDFRVDGLDNGTAQRWLDALGADHVINRRGTTWRQLDVAERSRAETDAAAVLVAHPSLVKRPVFDRNGELAVGFAKADAEQRLAWLQAD